MEILLILSKKLPKINYGSSMRTWSFINALSKNNRLSIFSIDNDVYEDRDVGTERQFFKTWCLKDSEENKHTFLFRLKIIISFIKSIPYEVAYTHQVKKERFLQKILETNKFDLIFSRYIRTSSYLLRSNKIKTILDLDDLEFLRFSQQNKLKKMNLWKRIKALLNNWILKQYHKKLVKIGKVLVCSTKDKEYLEKKIGLKNVSIVPNSIDFNLYKEVTDLSQEIFKNRTLLLCGLLNYAPNIDGVKWFIEEILPKIKKKVLNVKIHIVGRNPTNDIYKYKDGAITIYPNVPSMIPYYQNSSIAIVPLRAGGGTRIKILEALACRRPIVTTSIGAEGLNLIQKKHCIIANNAEDFANGCIELLNSYELALKLTENGYKLVSEHYDINTVQKTINEVFTNT